MYRNPVGFGSYRDMGYRNSYCVVMAQNNGIYFKFFRETSSNGTLAREGGISIDYVNRRNRELRVCEAGRDAIWYFDRRGSVRLDTRGLNFRSDGASICVQDSICGRMPDFGRSCGSVVSRFGFRFWLSLLLRLLGFLPCVFLSLLFFLLF